MAGLSQSCPNNGDFELGNTTGWRCKWGGYGVGTAPPFSTILPNLSCINQNGINAAPNANNRHTIMGPGAGNDVNSGVNAGTPIVPRVAPGNMFPTGANVYSFRLGNDATGGFNYQGKNLAQAEAISFDIQVNPNNAGFTYMYACFLEEPNDHPPESMPRFEILVKDAQGTIVPCGYYKVVAGDTASKTFYQGKDLYLYRNWTKVGMDLTAYMGQTLTIEFRTSDCFPPANGTSTSCVNNVCTTTRCSSSGCTTCYNNGQPCKTTLGGSYSPGSHSAYAYIDAYCIPLEITAPAICAGSGSIQICAPPGYLSYTWPANQPGLTGNLNSQCVTINNPVPGTEYMVNMTLVTGCPTFTKVTLKGLNITLQDTVLCPGTTPSYTLCAKPSAPGNYTYNWTPSTGLSCTTCECPVVTTPASPVTYTVTVSDPSAPGGCPVTKTVTITPECPKASVSVTGDKVCEGSCSNLQANAVGGIPPYTFTWIPAIGTGPGPFQICPTSTSSYTVILTDSIGDSDTAIANIIINPLPVISASTGSICANDSITLTASGASLYTWIPSGGLNTSTGAVVKASPSSTATYTIIGLDANGCMNSSVSTVTVNPLPLPYAGPDVAICSGTPVILTATGGGTYIWNPTAGLSSGTGSPVTANPGSTTTYTLTVVDQNKCQATDEVTVFVNSIPAITVMDTAICAGGQAILTASGASSYTWSTPSGPVFGNTLTVSPGVTTTYTITGENTGCTASATASITVNPNPIVNFGPYASGCTPLTVQFNNTTIATLGSACVWNFGDGSPPEINNCLPSHTYKSPGTYSVSLTVTTPEGCSGTLTIPNLITVYPFPKASFTANPWETTIMDPAIQFTNTSSGDSVRLWTFGDGTSDTQNHPVHIYEDTGRYVVCLNVINSFGCQDSVCQTVIIKPVWSFYIPNAFTPNGDGHNETFNGKGENIFDYRIIIFDRWGNQIFESNSLYRDWDGRANGGSDIAQQDVYVYLVSFKDIHDKKHKLTGIVTLIR